MIIVTRYTASWCGPCKVLAPVMEKVKQHYQGKPVKFEIVDIDNDRERAINEGVRSVPTVKIGNKTIVGAQDFRTYINAIDDSLGISII